MDNIYQGIYIHIRGVIDFFNYFVIVFHYSYEYPAVTQPFFVHQMGPVFIKHLPRPPSIITAALHAPPAPPTHSRSRMGHMLVGLTVGACVFEICITELMCARPSASVTRRDRAMCTEMNAFGAI